MIQIKTLLATTAIVLGFSNISLAFQDAYPTGPESDMTPGVLCTTGQTFRYPEKIRYCNRNVDKSLKDQIIREYDQNYGYKIRQMDRQKFKIDHLIPLCMGGGNDKANLWPQHETVYSITDPFEQKLCELMAAGKLKQAQAMQIILGLKSDLEHVDEYERMVREIENRPGKGSRK